MTAKSAWISGGWLEPGPISGHTDDTGWLMLPRQVPVGGSPLIIYCHGTALAAWPTRATGLVPTNTGNFILLGRLCNMGATVLYPAIGDASTGGIDGVTSINGYGNTYTTARVEAWRTWVASVSGTSTVQGITINTNTVGFIGDSMGNMTATSYARDYTARVAAIAGWCPLSDCKSFREDLTNGLRFLPNDAWGLVDGDPTPAAMDQLTTAALQGIPWRGYYTADDPIIPPSSVQALASWTGGTAINVGTGGHDVDQWGLDRLDWYDFRNWFCPLIGLPIA